MIGFVGLNDLMCQPLALSHPFSPTDEYLFSLFTGRMARKLISVPPVLPRVMIGLVGQKLLWISVRELRVRLRPQ